MGSILPEVRDDDLRGVHRMAVPSMVITCGTGCRAPACPMAFAKYAACPSGASVPRPSRP